MSIDVVSQAAAPRAGVVPETLSGFRLMAVHAHPDDESSKGAATTAMYAHEGAEVLVVSCTGGERGDILNPKMKDNEEAKTDMVGLRRREMAAAQEALGVQHEWLGFMDSGLPEGDPLPPLPEGSFAAIGLDAPVEALVRSIRRFRPHVVTTYDEQGGYPHPDHIRTHDVSVAAFRAAGDPTMYPDAGPAWQPLKLYYNQGLGLERLRVIHAAMHERGLESPFTDWIKRREKQKRAERTITTRVDAHEWFDARDQALLAHATQIDPDSFWFGVPREVEQEVWPWEDFEVAVSYVPVPTLPEIETSLFAGLVDSATADEMARTPQARPDAPVFDEVKERK